MHIIFFISFSLKKVGWSGLHNITSNLIAIWYGLKAKQANYSLCTLIMVHTDDTDNQDSQY